MIPGVSALPGSDTTVIMPALGGVQVLGSNGQVSNNMILPSAGVTNFVPDPSTLVSTNYFAMPAPNGLPVVGPGTTNFPGITLGNQAIQNISAGPTAIGDEANWNSITKPFVRLWNIDFMYRNQMIWVENYCMVRN